MLGGCESAIAVFWRLFGRAKKNHSFWFGNQSCSEDTRAAFNYEHRSTKTETGILKLHHNSDFAAVDGALLRMPAGAGGLRSSAKGQQSRALNPVASRTGKPYCSHCRNHDPADSSSCDLLIH